MPRTAKTRGKTKAASKARPASRTPPRSSSRKAAAPIEKATSTTPVTHIRGRDPRPYLAGAQPGQWASDHLEEANQCRGWQFVAVRTLSRMCSQAELRVHRVNDVAGVTKKLARIEKKIASVNRVYASDPIARTYRTERLELQREQLRRRIISKTNPDAIRPDREPATPDNPLVKLLNRVNPEWSGVTFLFALVQQIALTGIGLVWCVRNGLGVPVELYVIPTGLTIPRSPTPEFPNGSFWLTPLSTWGMYPSNGVWGTGPLDQALLTGAEIDARDVKKICYPHPLYLSDGLSPLAAGALWVDIGNEMDRSSWYKFQNAERPGLVFYQDKDVDPGEEDKVQFREDLKADAAGTPNTGKHLIVPKGLKGENWATTAAEMDYENSRPQIRDMNLTLHGVTPIACGISEAQAFSAFWASIKQTRDLAVQPLLNLIGGELTEFVGSAFGARHEIAWFAPAIDDPQVLEQRLRTDIQAGNALKVDEYRALRGLAPLGGPDGEAFVGVKTSVKDVPDVKEPADQTPNAKPGAGDGVTDEAADRDAQLDQPDKSGPGTRSPFRDTPDGAKSKVASVTHRR
jgi:hypothetical protein